MDRRHKNIRNGRLASVRGCRNIGAYYVSESLHQHPWRAIRRCRLERQKWKPLVVWRGRLGIGGGGIPPATLDAPMNDLWVCPIVTDQCQWQLVGAYDPTVITANPPCTSTTLGGQIICDAQTENQGGVYGTPGIPGGRYGAA